jgi:hypothetical protein
MVIYTDYSAYMTSALRVRGGKGARLCRGNENLNLFKSHPAVPTRTRGQKNPSPFLPLIDAATPHLVHPDAPSPSPPFAHHEALTGVVGSATTTHRGCCRRCVSGRRSAQCHENQRLAPAMAPDHAGRSSASRRSEPQTLALAHAMGLPPPPPIQPSPRMYLPGPPPLPPLGTIPLRQIIICLDPATIKHMDVCRSVSLIKVSPRTGSVELARLPNGCIV